MLKSINGSIESVTVLRSGMKNNRAWTMFNVIIAGENFTTFDTKYRSNIGKQGTWEYEEKQDGQYLNRTLNKYPEVKVESENTDELNIRAFGVIRGDIKSLKEEMQRGFNNLQEMINTILVEDAPNDGPITSVKEDIPVIENPLP